MNYLYDITIAESCQWIPVGKCIPEDKQYCITLCRNGICQTEVFYRWLYENGRECGYGPAGCWDEGDWERIYWLPIPSLAGLDGYEPASYMVQREAKHAAS